MTGDRFRFPRVEFGPEERALREEVRAFIREERASGGFTPMADSWGSGWSPEWSRKMGARGWLGMMWPKQYGGGEKPALHRYIVTEEMVSAGAPCAAHWVADRQSGPLLLRYGTEEQRRSILPRIAAGECYFAIGMSEPDSGSDLASVRTTATKVDGGWRINGRKIWSSGAHRSHYMIALVRTQPRDMKARHAGLTQFLIDLKSPGIEIRGIRNIAGERHFNETVFDDAFVPDDMVIGEAGDGWRQVTSELAIERSGPGTVPLHLPGADGAGARTRPGAGREGRRNGRRAGGADHGAAAHVARHIQAAGRRRSPGSRRRARQGPRHPLRGRAGARGPEPAARNGGKPVPRPLRQGAGGRRAPRALLHHSRRHQRGAEGHRRAGTRPPMSDRIVLDTAERILADLCPPEVVNDAETGVWPAALWEALEESGLTLAWLSEELGGGGAETGDGFDILKAAGAWAVPAPLAETLLAGWLLEQGGLAAPGGPMTVAPVGPADTVELEDGVLSGTARQVPFARQAGHVALLAADRILLVEHEACALVPGTSLAGEARDDIALDGVRPLRSAPAPEGLDRDRLTLVGAAVRAAQMAGALSRLLDQSVQYAQEREQFGRPIGRFQAVQHALAELAGEAAAAEAAVDAAGEAVAAGDFGPAGVAAIAAAKVRTGEAASKGAAIAHQVHGAMGFTYEHSLHHRTRRLWCWRDEFGNERVWSVRLGRLIAAEGADTLWPFVTGSHAA